MASTESVSHGDLVVCSCGNEEFNVRDAIDAALFRNDVDLAWRELLRRIAATHHAETQELEMDDEAFDAAAEAFRYQYDLITAEETEQWLAARGLNLDDFSEFFSRQYWGNAVTEELQPQDIDYLSAPADMRDLFAVESILNGQVERMLMLLSWRLAALAAEKDADAAVIAAQREAFLDRHELKEAEVPAWLAKLGRDDKWLEWQVAMEAAYERRQKSVLSPNLYDKELAMQRLPLTRFETEVIETESRDAAQEAIFCVREDGMSVEEVATESRYPYRRIDFVLEDLGEELQQKFLSVSDGNILEPIDRGDGFEVCRVIKKIEPRSDDPMIRARIETRLLYRHFTDLASKHVDQRLGMAIASE